MAANPVEKRKCVRPMKATLEFRVVSYAHTVLRHAGVCAGRIGSGL
jgi:hypothetical protein